MTVKGPSMSPLLNGSASLKDDIVYVSKHPRTRSLRYLRRGDVVAFVSPLHPEKMAVKRVVAVEGDCVLRERRDASFPTSSPSLSQPEGTAREETAIDKHNGKTGGGLWKSNSKEKGNADAHPQRETNYWHTLPPQHIWVEGDNQAEEARWSLDSRTYGPVPVGLVVGRVERVVWPWGRRGEIGRKREGRRKGRSEVRGVSGGGTKVVFGEGVEKVQVWRP